MNPQQAPAPYNPDPYRFIMEPPKKPKPPVNNKLGSVSNNPFLMRIIFIVGGAVVTMIILAIFFNTFFATKTNTTDIVDIVETQQEIIRVADQGTRASSGDVKNAAVSTKLSLITEQQGWLTFLQKHGRKVAPKELSLKASSTTDKQLTNAIATSTFDSTFTQIMRNELTAYAAALKDAYTNSTSTSEKNMLSSNYGQVQLLLKQWPTAAAGTGN